MSDTEARARDAAAIINSPLFQEAIEHLRTEAINGWVGTKAAQTDDRERLWIMIKMADRLKGYFQAIIDENRFAASKVAREPLP